MLRALHLIRPARRRIWNKAKKTGEVLVIRRALIVVNVAAGRAASETADTVGCAKSHVYDVLAGFFRPDVDCAWLTAVLSKMAFEIPTGRIGTAWVKPVREGWV